MYDVGMIGKTSSITSESNYRHHFGASQDFDCASAGPPCGLETRDQVSVISLGRVKGLLLKFAAIFRSKKDFDRRKVQVYNFDELIYRMVDKYHWDENRARTVFEETKMFLYDAATSNQPHYPSREVDEVWHNFILFTTEYNEFCQVHFGRYIHHKPKRRGEVYEGRCSCSGQSCQTRPCKT